MNRSDLVRRHWKLGFWGLLFFLSLGMFLESLHGFKVSWYLNVSSETRRLMWRLAHAHGTVFSLLNLVYALCLLAARPVPAAAWCSRCVVAGTLLVPVGFFLGGLVVRGGDPSAGVFLVPIGGLALLVGIGWSAVRLTPAREETPHDPGDES